MQNNIDNEILLKKNNYLYRKYKNILRERLRLKNKIKEQEKLIEKLQNIIIENDWISVSV
jgi:hypothetical protein